MIEVPGRDQDTGITAALCTRSIESNRELWNEFNIYLYMVNRYIQFACDIMLAIKGFLSITLLPLRNSHNMSFASMDDCISQIVYTDWDSCLSSTTIRFWKIFAQLQMRILFICIWRICVYFIEWISCFITHQILLWYIQKLAPIVVISPVLATITSVDLENGGSYIYFSIHAIYFGVYLLGDSQPERKLAHPAQPGIRAYVFMLWLAVRRLR